jgi:hypothetical protein
MIPGCSSRSALNRKTLTKSQRRITCHRSVKDVHCTPGWGIHKPSRLRAFVADLFWRAGLARSREMFRNVQST